MTTIHVNFTQDENGYNFMCVETAEGQHFDDVAAIETELEATDGTSFDLMKRAILKTIQAHQSDFGITITNQEFTYYPAHADTVWQ